MSEHADEIRALLTQRERLKKREARKVYAVAIFILVATLTLYHFAATVPDGKGIDWQQMRATGAARTDQGGEK